MRDVENSGAANTDQIASISERDPVRLADMIERDAPALVEAFRAHGGEKMNYVAGFRASSSSVAALVVGEFYLHGWDIAQAAKVDWTIPPGAALAMVRGAAELMPMYVSPEAATFRGTFAVRLEGGLTMTISFAHGAMTVTEGVSGRPDCRIWADPVAFALTSSGRSSRWSAALKGKIVTYGRKPWLGLRLPALIRNP